MTRFVHSAALRNAWFPVARVEDIGEGALAVRLLDEKFVVWRTNDDALVADR